jgi:hypothetical protein
MIKEILRGDQFPALGYIPFFRAIPDEDDSASAGSPGRFHGKLANAAKGLLKAGHVSIPVNHAVKNRSRNLKRFRKVLSQYLIIHQRKG